MMTDDAHSGIDFIFQYPKNWYCGDIVQLATHANVENTCAIQCGGGEEGKEETAWGGSNAFSTPKWAYYSMFNIPCEGNFNVEEPLTAANGTLGNAGTITITKNGANLAVTYNANGWNIYDVHMHIASTLNGIPHAGNGNPVPGQFDHSANAGGANTYTFLIPLNTLTCGRDYYLATHAAVRQSSGGGAIQPGTVMSAWGFGTPFDNIGIDRWGWFFNYEIQCGH
jgi:hypothetical protein